MVLGRGTLLVMIVINLQVFHAPGSFNLRTYQGPDEASGRSELESENYDEISEHRDLERVRERENQTLARHRPKA